MGLGFALTLAATAAGLVPPYLTVPLINELTHLSVAGEGHLANVGWYLGLTALAAIFTWLATWGQGIVMAWVSERISADLRNHTYAHLQRLSLEYFRRQAHRRPDGAHQHRHRADLSLSSPTTWSTSPPTC